MVESVIKIKIGARTNVGVSAQIQSNIKYVERIISGVLIHVVEKMVNM